MVSFNDYLKFREYLFDLAKKEDKPFNCPALAVLPENVVDTCEHKTYPSGDLLCSYTPGSIGVVPDHGCRIAYFPIKVGDDGNINLLCSWNHSQLVLKVIDFKPSGK
ncbi:MAG: hypothetical protein KKG60_03195 [Nanoarchaeota archaeon]|nr:hypothetical protein [Nanoarchaeota archaeon]